MLRMIYHSNGSRLLSHFIRPEYLVDLLRRRAFCLVRQDLQSDPADGVLPASCFESPHVGPLERSLGLSPEFLINQAHAVAGLRNRTFIMCWTCDPAGHMRANYGENGRRCELQTSENGLKRMLGYERTPDVELWPKRRSVPEILGGRTIAELKDVLYSDGAKPVPVVPSAWATAHKAATLAAEAELRVEAVIDPPELELDGKVARIGWELMTAADLFIVLGSQVGGEAAEEIAHLAARLGIVVRREMPG